MSVGIGGGSRSGSSGSTAGSQSKSGISSGQASKSASTSQPSKSAKSTGQPSKSTASTQSYLSGFNLFPSWTTKDGPTTTSSDRESKKVPPNASLDQLGDLGRSEKTASTGADHKVSHWHGLNPKSYPVGCPGLPVHWFHAVDVPKRKPFNNTVPPVDAATTTATTTTTTGTDKLAPKPKKYTAFSDEDSAELEIAFQRLADEEERQISSESKRLPAARPQIRVPVSEDYLFDVDIQNRELAPAYWLGPTYDVRRGTWFTLEGSQPRPVAESLAVQLEDGYLRLKPWLWIKPTTGKESAVIRSKSRPRSQKGVEETLGLDSGPASRPGSSHAAATPVEQSIHLFGEHANLLVAYQDEKTAWVTTNDFISRMGGFLTGYKVFRGYWPPTTSTSSTATTSGSASKPDQKGRTVSATSTFAGSRPTAENGDGGKPMVGGPDEAGSTSQTPSQIRFEALQRQISSMGSAEQEDETIRQQDEHEIVEDYQEQAGDERGRQIDHLILVTHGIGQRLGLRVDRVNFVHDVNTFRKTIKAVYAGSDDLQALNDEIGEGCKNSRVQVLPVCWRHLLDFPRTTLRRGDPDSESGRAREYDLGDVPAGALDEREDAATDAAAFPGLDDITLDGILPFRNFLTDLGLDILLYQNEKYRAEIGRIVAQECNRVYRLFLERNPSFHGRVSLIGHSLGSAVVFDILCAQQDPVSETAVSTGLTRRRAGSFGRRSGSEQVQLPDVRLQLDFDVEHFMALGSPVGLFYLLNGTKVCSRPNRRMKFQPGVVDSDDSFVAENRNSKTASGTGLGLSDFTFSSPTDLTDPDGSTSGTSSDPFSHGGLARPRLTGGVYNIFFPSDPIAYRVEPLVSPAMAVLKPQSVPYTKKGLFANAVASQGLTSIGAKVGQSMSGLWSSVSHGIANSLLNKHLGLDGSTPPNMASGSTPPTGNVAGLTGEDGGPVGPVPPSVNPNVETLYANFRKRHPVTSASSSGQTGSTSTFSITSFLSGAVSAAATPSVSTSLPSSASGPIDREARRLRREEAKVRSLNRTGRLDYAIQEGAFDNFSFSFLSSLASHLLYWADEDVAHFVVGQVLTSGTRRRPTSPTSNTTITPTPNPTSNTSGPVDSSGKPVKSAMKPSRTDPFSFPPAPPPAAATGPPSSTSLAHARMASKNSANGQTQTTQPTTHKRMYSADANFEGDLSNGPSR